MQNKPQTKSYRLKNYDYKSNGYYFITINTKEKKHILSNITNKYEIELSEIGYILKEAIDHINNTNIKVAKYVIMPNHIHILIKLENSEKSLVEIIKNFKRYTARKAKKEYGILLWDYSYYERVVRSEKELLNVMKYIDENSFRWKEKISKEDYSF